MRSPERLRHLAVDATFLLVGLAVAACSGGSSSRSPLDSTSAPAIRPAAQQQLRTDLHSVTTAAARGDLAGARNALTTLNTDLTAAHAAGSITATRFGQIRHAANAVDAALARPTTPAPPTTSATVAPPAQSGGANRKKNGNGRKSGGGGDGGD